MIILKRTATLYSTDFQFFVHNGSLDIGMNIAESWTKQAVHNRFAVVGNIIGIRTGSDGEIRVEIEAHDYEPDPITKNADFAIEASISAHEHYVVINGTMDGFDYDKFDVEVIEVPSWWYRVRCYGYDLALAEPEGEDGQDWYLVQFWQADESSPTILKSWSGGSN